ncbi:oxygenase MpaB family protein [Flavisolibacter nicotianae]|uniref:oxygenase MpaB family protein n=1 Tax=Flavisolibacter nicotianae TaxID=2364882 RepID=UPI000EAEA47D|nr:oxygenase MpaB family protein [Flavisolibacter nicotianae]
MSNFVKQDSIVRKIWGKSDTILFIFAGAAAEFALNKAVDWLYFTSKLPSDPLGRLFSTVTYARQIVFAPKDEAERAIDRIASIHAGVEKARGARIPDWAYRDVLFMLIHYSIAAYELLEEKLSPEEKEEVYNVFLRVGQGMKIPGLPPSYEDWLPVRQAHMHNDLARSRYTEDLFRQYKKHLGLVRYALLVEAQILVVPKPVSRLLQFRKFSFLSPLVPLYKLSKWLKLDAFVKLLLLPQAYKKQIDALDVAT